MDDTNQSPSNEAELPSVSAEPTPPVLNDIVEEATPISAAIAQVVDAVVNGDINPTIITAASVGLPKPASEDVAEQAAAQPSADEIIPSNNTTQTYPVYTNVEENGVRDPAEETLSVLQVNTQRAVDILEAHEDTDRSFEARRWDHMIRQSIMAHPQGLQYESTVTREGANFRQYGESPKGEIAIAVPRFDDAGGKLLRGEPARLRVRALLGMGSLKTIPLWHSGFHITLKTPSDSALLELRRRMQEDKIEFGRRTHGLVFSNISSYWNGYLLDMAMAHVHSHTVKDHADVRDLIQTQDLPILFWGLAASIWPQGFHFTRADLTTAGKEKKTFHKGLININKILWTDNSQLTDVQKTHMSNRTPHSMTIEQINLYRSQFVLAQGRTVEVGPTDNPIKITLKAPPALDYIRSGHRWVSGLVDIVERTFTSAQEDLAGRSAAILEHANATLMRQYGHWIASIEFQGSDIITDIPTLDDICNSLAEHDATRSKLLEEVYKFIDDCTVSLVGIPESNTEYVGPTAFPRIIPLDVISAFFILLMQRTKKHTTEE